MPIHIETRFVEIDLPRSQLPNGQVLPVAIEALLQAWGQPLRWAITRVDKDSLHIEATLTSKPMDQKSEA
jgi:hypothetical protein